MVVFLLCSLLNQYVVFILVFQRPSTNVVSATHLYGHKSHFVDFANDDVEYRYIIEGDLNIGAIFPIHKRGSNGPCGNGLRESGVVQYVEALVFAINEINNNPKLLPNYTLGAVVLDDCDTDETALGQALHFMPLHSRTSRQGVDCAPYQEDFTFYDVVGVIGSEGSDACIMIANVLGLFNVPQISSWATSDLLSDKKRYPYFMRTVPPDRFQVQAILHVILHFNWTYISTIYSEGGYGEEAFEQFSRLLEQEKSICVGTAITVTPDDKAYVYQKAIQTLYDSKVLVVVLFTDQEEARAILQAAKHSGLEGHFVWIGSDGLGINIDDFDGLEEIARGSLMLLSYSVPVPEFQSYFEGLQPGSTDNPWFNEMWQDFFKCSLYPHHSQYTERCVGFKQITDASDYSPEAYVSTIIDTVYVFATALDKYINERCAAMSVDSIRSCIKGNILIDYLHNVTLAGHNGLISFDKNGDLLGKYEIHNFQRLQKGKYGSKQVGKWDASTHKLQINETDIIWNVKRKNQIIQGRGTSVPTSQCGEICAEGQIYSYFRDTCCWECRSCNTNEITAVNATKCLDCPRFTWPNYNKTSCHDLVPYYVEWDDVVAIVFVIISIVGVAACSVLFVVFVLHNDNRLIKATSRELSYIMLGGVTIQYVLLLPIISMPNDFVCYLNYIGFNVSFSVVYAPLLTRTNRIFRIFHSGRRTKISPSFTSPISQVIIALSLVGIQVLINIIVLISSPPSVTLRMPVPSNPQVELTCALPVQGFVTSLCYNLLLVSICTYYAFKTRTLPDNFNESRYITLCVYTTLVIWLAFLPSYFTNNHAFFQIILLCCALILNATVILLCLFTPKVYAIFRGVQSNSLVFKTTVRKPTMDPAREQMCKRPCQPLHVDDENTELCDLSVLPTNGDLNSCTDLR